MNGKDQKEAEDTQRIAKPEFGPESSPRRIGFGDTCLPPSRSALTEIVKSEQVAVGSAILEAVRAYGKGWVSVKQVCEALGIDYSAQAKRLKSAKWAVVAVVAITATDGKSYDTMCIDISKIAHWFAALDTARIKNEEVKATLEDFQLCAAQALDIWFRGPQPIPPAPVPALRFEVGNGDALEVAQHLITAMKHDRLRVDQIADRQTTQETALASNVTKTEQLTAKVDALSAKRSRSLDGIVHVSAVKVAAELGIQPLAFKRFVTARNVMRLLQRKDGKWPLDLTVVKYRELIADPSHPVYAEVERVVPTIQRAAVSKYLRAWAATQRTMNADQYADAMNLCYDAFTRRAGYDPRVLATGRLSPLDVVQVRGHIDLLLQVMHEVCPMTDGGMVGHA